MSRSTSVGARMLQPPGWRPGALPVKGNNKSSPSLQGRGSGREIEPDDRLSPF